MKLTTITSTENRLARAWYVKYALDPFALGPYRFGEFVPATDAIEIASVQFGERPCAVWPEGEIEEVDGIRNRVRLFPVLATAAVSSSSSISTKSSSSSSYFFSRMR